jgi:dTMP kinase
MAPGRFITFEGGEGSGKSTHARLLSERLRARGIGVVETREPGGSPFAERLRGILLGHNIEPHSPMSEALLFYAARADHLDAVIRPALRDGRWVVCDRFSDSTRVYQGYAGSLREQIIEALELLVVTPTKPDLTFIIDVPTEIGLGRVAVRGSGMIERAGAKLGADQEQGRVAQGLLADRYESRDFAFHRRVREGFLKIAAAEPDRCAVINGQRPTEEVASAVWAAVEERLLAGAD